MKTIEQTYEMKASPDEVFDALTNPAVIEKWSGGSALMNDEVGTEFSLWDGSIHGKNVEIISNQKIVQEWYGGEWDRPSKATFTLTAKAEGTTVDLLHENVPDSAYKDIDEGWKKYYLGPMREMFEQ